MTLWPHDRASARAIQAAIEFAIEHRLIRRHPVEDPVSRKKVLLEAYRVRFPHRIASLARLSRAFQEPAKEVLRFVILTLDLRTGRKSVRHGSRIRRESDGA